MKLDDEKSELIVKHLLLVISHCLNLSQARLFLHTNKGSQSTIPPQKILLKVHGLYISRHYFEI